MMILIANISKGKAKFFHQIAQKKNVGSKHWRKRYFLLKKNNIPFKLSGQGYGTGKKAIKES